MKRILLFVALVLCAPLAVRAQGVTDFVVDPTSGITISVPGSYRLAADATMITNASAITVTVGGVTLDLNGHTVQGTSGGTGVGVDGHTATGRINLRNGTIRLFGGTGVDLTSQNDCTLSDLHIAHCGRAGVIVGPRAHVLRVKAFGNAWDGIAVSAESVVENCSAISNNLFGNFAGIYASGDSCVIRDCLANENNPFTSDGGTTGISVASSSLVEHCTAEWNTGTGVGDAFGIHAGPRCTITGNRANSNSPGSSGFEGAGIAMDSGCVVSGNVCIGNRAPTFTIGFGVGISTTENCLIENNVCNQNSANGTSGDGYGIRAQGRCIIRGNNTSANNGSGGLAASFGIYANGRGSRIESNNCALHIGSASSWGIAIFGDHHFIRANTTTGGFTGGILLQANSCRVQENSSYADADPLSDAGSSNSLGAGDLANVAIP